jgi:anti-anti-sigma factor
MATLGIAVEAQGGVPTLRLSGTLDQSTAHELAPTVDELVARRPSHVIVDLAGLELIESPGVAALVGLYKRVRAEGGELDVVNARDQPLAILKLLRMDKVFLK